MPNLRYILGIGTTIASPSNVTRFAIYFVLFLGALSLESSSVFGAEPSLAFLDQQIEVINGDRAAVTSANSPESPDADILELMQSLHAQSVKNVRLWYLTSTNRPQLVEEMRRRDFLGKFLGLLFLERYPLRFEQYSDIKDVVSDILNTSELSFEGLMNPLINEIVYRHNFTNNKRVDLAHAVTDYLRIKGDFESYLILREMGLRVFWSPVVGQTANITDRLSEMACAKRETSKMICRVRGRLIRPEDKSEKTKKLLDYINDGIELMDTVHPTYRDQVSSLMLGCTVLLKSLSEHRSKTARQG